MALVDRVLTVMRVQRDVVLGGCIVCHRRVHDGPEALRLPRRTYAHRRCATYRMRRSAASRGIAAPLR
jgi:hypothetical protein